MFKNKSCNVISREAKPVKTFQVWLELYLAKTYVLMSVCVHMYVCLLCMVYIFFLFLFFTALFSFIFPALLWHYWYTTYISLKLTMWVVLLGILSRLRFTHGFHHLLWTVSTADLYCATYQLCDLRCWHSIILEVHQNPTETPSLAVLDSQWSNRILL